MLKAKFINSNDLRHAHHGLSNSGNSASYPENNGIRLEVLNRNGNSKRKLGPSSFDKPSTRESFINRTNCSSHAHSDGGLHALCRHKRFTSKRQSSLSPRQTGHVVSYQNIDVLRRKSDGRVRCSRSDTVGANNQAVVYDQQMSLSDSPVLRITLRM